jgi:iron complex transport system substrate-binding protein
MQARFWALSVTILSLLTAGAVWLTYAANGPAETGPATRRATADTSASRVVAMAPSSVEIICELGAGGQLVGVGRFCQYPPAVRALPKVGGLHDPDMEQILLLGPDLLITRGRSEVLIRLCRGEGIRIYEDPSDTLADIYRAIREIGDLLGRSREAAVLGERMRMELEAVRRRVGGRRPVRVLLTMRQPGPVGEIYTVGRGPYLNELIGIAGGDNIFGDLEVAYPEVSAEEVLIRAPEVIVEVRPGTAGDETVRAAAIGQWRQLGPLPAVKSGRVFLVTQDYALIPSPRLTQMADLLARSFHPEVVFDE